MLKLDSPLARMKALAFGLLLVAAALYGVAHTLMATHPVFAGYLEAFAEAAMVGAIADWFAVTALFRRPLGLPIPHTAIIPRNKARIGANLGDFICTHFLSREQVLAKVTEFDSAQRLAGWLGKAQNASALAGVATQLAAHGVRSLRDERVRQFVRKTAMGRLEHIDLASLAGQLLEVLTDDGRAQEVLDEMLEQLDDWLQDDATQARIAALLADEFDMLRVKILRMEVPLHSVVGNWSAGKVVKRVSAVISEVNHDPEHPLRKRFERHLASWVERLKHDPAFRLRAAELRAQLMQHPALASYLTGLIDDVIHWFEEDIRRDDSILREQLGKGAHKLGAALRKDAAMQAWINEQVLAMAGPLVERYRAQIGRYIAERIELWNEQELVEQLEAQVGKDLQFIRINGTLVGGLVGLMIHGVSAWWG